MTEDNSGLDVRLEAESQIKFQNKRKTSQTCCSKCLEENSWAHGLGRFKKTESDSESKTEKIVQI